MSACGERRVDRSLAVRSAGERRPVPGTGGRIALLAGLRIPVMRIHQRRSPIVTAALAGVGIERGNGTRDARWAGRLAR
jgi:hypothetical protein